MLRQQASLIGKSELSSQLRPNAEEMAFPPKRNSCYNVSMAPKLSNDIEQFIAAAPSGAAQIEGANGATYWVMTDEAMRVRQYVQEGIEQADRGDVAPWDSDEIKAAGRQLKQERSA